MSEQELIEAVKLSYTDALDAASVHLVAIDDAEQSVEMDKWELARLTYENTVSGAGRLPSGIVSMARWCSDLQAATGHKFSSSTAKRYRAAWEDYGLIRPARSELPRFEDAYWEIRASQGESKEEMTARRSVQAIEKATPEVKQEAFKRLARDPEVQEGLRNDYQAREQLEEIVEQARPPEVRRMFDRPTKREEYPRPVVWAFANAHALMWTASHRLMDAGPMSPTDKEEVIGYCTRIQKWAEDCLRLLVDGERLALPDAPDLNLLSPAVQKQIQEILADV